VTSRLDDGLADCDQFLPTKDRVLKALFSGICQTQSCNWCVSVSGSVFIVSTSSLVVSDVVSTTLLQCLNVESAMDI
jgi:ubiquitin C-terminal hydrolase